MGHVCTQRFTIEEVEEHQVIHLNSSSWRYQIDNTLMYYIQWYWYDIDNIYIYIFINVYIYIDEIIWFLLDSDHEIIWNHIKSYENESDGEPVFAPKVIAVPLRRSRDPGSARRCWRDCDPTSIAEQIMEQVVVQRFIYNKVQRYISQVIYQYTCWYLMYVLIPRYPRAIDKWNVEETQNSRNVE